MSTVNSLDIGVSVWKRAHDGWELSGFQSDTRAFGASRVHTNRRLKGPVNVDANGGSAFRSLTVVPFETVIHRQLLKTRRLEKLAVGSASLVPIL